MHKNYFTSLCAVIGIMTASCNDIVDYNDNYDDGMTSYGAPVITGVYDVADTDMSEPLDEADFGRFIMLRGENLSNVTKVLFNDIEIDVNEIYATATGAWLEVPAKAPEVISNKIYYSTALGDTEYDFTVIIPDVEIIGLYNEMALPGELAKVSGRYFDLHGFGRKETSKVTMNGEELAVSDITDSGMTVAIPENASPNSSLTFEWMGVNGVVAVTVPYACKEALIFDDWTGMYWGDGVLVDTPADGQPPLLCGPYFCIDKPFFAWEWYTVFGAGFGISDEIASNPEEYIFKFETCSALSTPFPDCGDFGYLITFVNDTNKYSWNPSAEKSFNTFGEWCTVRIEFTDLVATQKPSGWCDFRMNFQPSMEVDIEHYFSGFRIEKKLKSATSL